MAEAKFPGMGDPERQSRSNLDPSTLKSLSTEELWMLRTRIDEILPPDKLKDLDLAHELVLQLKIAQKLQSDTLDDENTPANQRAQVVNSVAGAIQAISKLQVELYTSERLKKVEQCLIEAVQTLDTEAQNVFFEQYEKLLNRA